MKKSLICLIILLFSASAYAGTWCRWNGSQGFNCKSTIAAHVIIGGNEIAVNPETLNPLGWYQLTTTQPTIGVDRVKDEEIWALVGNQMSRTWSVRDMTQEEIDYRDAQALDLTLFFLLKGLLQKEVFTLQEAINWFPASTIKAYQARNRLEN